MTTMRLSFLFYRHPKYSSILLKASEIAAATALNYLVYIINYFMFVMQTKTNEEINCNDNWADGGWAAFFTDYCSGKIKG